MRTTVAAEGLFAMLDGAGLFDRASMHLLLAKDGYDAMSLCRNRVVDLVILQQTMGGVSGISVCRALKQAEPAPHIIIVLDQGDAPQRRTAEAAGADGLLVRPLEPHALINLAAQVLGVASREEVRVLTRLRCETTLSGRAMVIGTAIDISTSGMRVEAEAALRPGENVTAEFFLPGSPEACIVACKIMRVDKEEKLTAYGLRFVNPDRELGRKLREFVNGRQRPT